MAERKSYHVLYDRERAGWKVVLAGHSHAFRRTRLKRDAIEGAKKLARRARLGQVVIHGKDGRIQREYTYGRDPRNSRG